MLSLLAFDNTRPGREHHHTAGSRKVTSIHHILGDGRTYLGPSNSAQARSGSVDLHQRRVPGEPQSRGPGLGEFLERVPIMLRYILTPLAAVVLLTTCLIPDDAEARRGGAGYRGGGAYRGGAVAVRGPRGGGAVAVRGAGYRGGYRGYGYRRYGVGAAAVGAGAVGTAAYRRSCYDAYGNYICAY